MLFRSLVGSLYSTWLAWESQSTIEQSFLVIDYMTLFLILLITSIGIITLLNSLGYLQIHKQQSTSYASLILCSIVGMVFLFASNNLLVNFIGLETMSLSIYVLVGSHKQNIKSNEAGVLLLATCVAGPDPMLLPNMRIFFSSMPITLFK